MKNSKTLTKNSRMLITIFVNSYAPKVFYIYYKILDLIIVNQITFGLFIINFS